MGEEPTKINKFKGGKRVGVYQIFIYLHLQIYYSMLYDILFASAYY